DVRAFRFRQAIPDVRAENGDRLVGQLLGIFRIEVLGPVDAGIGVPLQLLALLVEAREPLARVLVFPLEGRVERPGNPPLEIPRGHRVPTLGRHGTLRVVAGSYSDRGAPDNGATMWLAARNRSTTCALPLGAAPS